MFKWLEKYFTFSRTERNGIVVLVILSFMVLIAPRVYFYFKPVEHADNSKYKQEIEAFEHGGNKDHFQIDTTSLVKNSVAAKPDAGQNNGPVKQRNTAYFYFDPNKIGVEEWVRLGFTEKQAQGIELYKQKGGRFYRPQDLMRLYAMDEEHYYKLKPFVKIDTASLPKRNYNRY